MNMVVGWRAWGVGLGLFAAALGAVGCVSMSAKATDVFEASRKCNEATATLRTDLSQDKAPYEVYEVSGCGTKALYQCVSTYAHRASPTAECSEMSAHAFEATDGSVRNGALSPWHFDGPAQEDALLASAVRDLPCDRGAITRLGKPSGDNLAEGNMLEGCGQRVTYKWTYDDEKRTGRVVLAGKVPTGAPPTTAP